MNPLWPPETLPKSLLEALHSSSSSSSSSKPGGGGGGGGGGGAGAGAGAGAAGGGGGGSSGGSGSGGGGSGRGGSCCGSGAAASSSSRPGVRLGILSFGLVNIPCGASLTWKQKRIRTLSLTSSHDPGQAQSTPDDSFVSDSCASMQGSRAPNGLNDGSNQIIRHFSRCGRTQPRSGTHKAPRNTITQAKASTKQSEGKKK